ncbi:hypothetical protein [Cellulomonas sp. HZM]|uniref:hypothetical protein n=1 Tax=Cellulomonas sp. HZM TaxID=1454010 RepID=UPI0012DE18A2|nr:hypothetical protein [Cellulomonas sp. HZM]
MVVAVGVVVELVRGDLVLALVSATSTAALALAGWSWIRDRSSMRATAAVRRRSARLAQATQDLGAKVDQVASDLDGLGVRLETIESDLVDLHHRTDAAPKLLP